MTTATIDSVRIVMALAELWHMVRQPSHSRNDDPDEWIASMVDVVLESGCPLDIAIEVIVGLPSNQDEWPTGRKMMMALGGAHEADHCRWLALVSPEGRA